MRRKSKIEKPGHVTKGSVFDALDLSPEEAAITKAKSKWHSRIMDIIDKKHYRSKELQGILDEYQSHISDLVNGKLSKMSLEKLIRYHTRLEMSDLGISGSSTENARRRTA